MSDRQDNGGKAGGRPRTCGGCRNWQKGFIPKCRLKNTFADYRDKACGEYKPK